MRLRGIALILLVASLGLGVAACGGDDGEDAGAEPAATEATTTGETEAETNGETGDGGGEITTLEVAADPNGALAYDTTSLQAAAGKIKLEFTNDASIPHNVTFEGVDAATDTVTGGSDTLDLDLEAGKYTFYCSVAGHRAAGMEGTLTVG